MSMERMQNPVDGVVETIFAKSLTHTEMRSLIEKISNELNGTTIVREAFKSPVNNLFNFIFGSAGLTKPQKQELLKRLQEHAPDGSTSKNEPKKSQEKFNLNDDKSTENIGEKKEEIDKRIVVTGTSDGFGVFDATNSKNEGAGATYDVRPVNDPSRYHFYHNYREVHEKWNKDNKPFTFIYNRDGKKYLYATAGLNAYSGKSNGGRNGNVFVSIELTEDLPSWAEEYILKRAIDLANKKFGKDFEVPIEFKEGYLSNFIISKAK